MKRVLKAALPLAVIALASCSSTKSYSSCKQDVERLKASIVSTSQFLEHAEAELQAADAIVRSCDDLVQPCAADDWVTRLKTLELDSERERAFFTRANETWRPAACLDYTSAYRLNPPPPERYRAYYENYDKLADRIDELIVQLEAY
ncbi:hypothetical protein WNY37_16000 [Henriciella sp. AS95]|uniref:hypothetical protein n=1 Tax=Henriciella sp. AS95 TaxID=3135782 RepID=UPI00317C35A7